MHIRLIRLLPARRAPAPALLASLATVASFLTIAPDAAAQDSVTVVAGKRYEAGPLREFIMGEGYRDAWTAPVRVEVLRPDTFAGGLTVDGEGGGFSTESLRLKGRNGREYVFRSVDKRTRLSLPEEFRGTVVNSVMQDMVPSKHPAVSLVIPPILRAVGILHVTPRLVVMPDHPFLGEFRQRFAGRLGQIEERPTDGNGNAGAVFARADDVEGSEDFRDKLEEDPEDVLDSRAFLTARLVDVMLGDWDRHWDQWRWARYDSAGRHVWKPIPRDRDNAATDQEGVIGALARMAVPMVTKFGPDYDDVFGLVLHASELDRTLLSDLAWSDWEAAAAFVQSRVTDRVIDDAVRRLPPEYHAIHGADFSRDLKGRRDRLREAAREFYEILATEVDVHTTDEVETADVRRLPDGSVEVEIVSEDEGRRIPYFRRRFLPDETREVRLFLHGGDDRVTVTGEAPRSVMVRAIGGGGDDRFADRSRAGGGRMTVFYDDRGDNQFEPGGEARVDEREYDPGPRSTLIRNAPPPRDWGAEMSWMTPYAEQTLVSGAVLGFGPAWTRYGFRRQPHATMFAVRALWAPIDPGYGVEAEYDVRHTSRPSRTNLRARVSTFADVIFFGYGNDTPGDDDDVEAFRVEQLQARGDALYFTRPWGRRFEIYAGPSLKWTDPGTVEADGPGVLGADAFVQYGARIGGSLDLRDTTVFTRSGLLLRAEASGYGADFGTFGGVTGDAATYLSPFGRRLPVLALRAGGRVAFGDFPFQEAAFVGGRGTVRGYPSQRFTGDAALFGNAELRQRLGRVNLLVVRPVVGVLALADAGRVYVDGDSPGGWHTALGGGLTFEAVGQVVTVSYANGDAGRLYVHLGLPF